MKPRLLSLLMLGLVLATLAGCGSYEPHIVGGGPTESSFMGTCMLWGLILLVLTICIGFLFRDGLWSNSIRLVNVIFAGLLAMNYHEAVARFVTNYDESMLHPYVVYFDFLAIWGCFAVFLALMLAITDKVSRVRVRFLKIVDQVGGVVFSAWIGWVMVCFIFASLHTAPMPRYFLFGGFVPQNSMAFGVFAPDREWLGFTKRMSEGAFCRIVSKEDLPNCAFKGDYIDKHMERRQSLENYVNGNKEHSSAVNPQFFKGSSVAQPKPSS